MWFIEEQIMTAKLKKTKAYYLDPLEKEMCETLSKTINNTGSDEIFFTNGNLDVKKGILAEHQLKGRYYSIKSSSWSRFMLICC